MLESFADCKANHCHGLLLGCASRLNLEPVGDNLLVQTSSQEGVLKVVRGIVGDCDQHLTYLAHGPLKPGFYDSRSWQHWLHGVWSALKQLRGNSQILILTGDWNMCEANILRWIARNNLPLSVVRCVGPNSSKMAVCLPFEEGSKTLSFQD